MAKLASGSRKGHVRDELIMTNSTTHNQISLSRPLLSILKRFIRKFPSSTRRSPHRILHHPRRSVCRFLRTSSLKRTRRSLFDITTTMTKRTCIMLVFPRDLSPSLSMLNLVIRGSVQDLNPLPQLHRRHLHQNPRSSSSRLIKTDHFCSHSRAG